MPCTSGEHWWRTTKTSRSWRIHPTIYYPDSMTVMSVDALHHPIVDVVCTARPKKENENTRAWRVVSRSNLQIRTRRPDLCRRLAVVAKTKDVASGRGVRRDAKLINDGNIPREATRACTGVVLRAVHGLVAGLGGQAGARKGGSTRRKKHGKAAQGSQGHCLRNPAKRGSRMPERHLQEQTATPRGYLSTEAAALPKWSPPATCRWTGTSH